MKKQLVYVRTYDTPHHRHYKVWLDGTDYIGDVRMPAGSGYWNHSVPRDPDFWTGAFNTRYAASDHLLLIHDVESRSAK